MGQIGFGTDHAGQTQQRVWRIIGVNAQIDAYLLRHGRYLLNKVIEILAKFSIADGGVLVQQSLKCIERKRFFGTG